MYNFIYITTFMETVLFYSLDDTGYSEIFSISYIFLV